LNNEENASYWAAHGFPFWNENAMGGSAFTKSADDRRTPAWFRHTLYLSKNRYLLKEIWPGQLDFTLDQYAAPTEGGTLMDRLNSMYWEANGFRYNQYLHRWVLIQNSFYKAHSPSSVCTMWSNLYDADQSIHCAICKKENAQRWLHFRDDALSVCCMEDFFVRYDIRHNRFLDVSFWYKPSYLQIVGKSSFSIQEVWPIYEEDDGELAYRVTGYYFPSVKENPLACDTVSGNDELSDYTEDEKVVQSVKDAPLQKTILFNQFAAAKVKDVVSHIKAFYENGEETQWYTLSFRSFETTFGRGAGGTGLPEEQKQTCLNAIVQDMRAKGLRPATQDFESYFAENPERMRSFPPSADFFSYEDEIIVRPLQLAYYIKNGGVLW
jgi:hypothetical protein